MSEHIDGLAGANRKSGFAGEQTVIANRSIVGDMT